MLIGLALIIVAVFLSCALLFRLSIYALPLFVAFGAAAGGRRNERAHEAVTYGVIGMDAYVFAAERLDATLPAAASTT